MTARATSPVMIALLASACDDGGTAGGGAPVCDWRE